MPALQLFGRRWLISSDDVPLPASFCALFHLVWCCLLVVWFISVHGPRECSGAWQYDIGVGGLLGSFALSFVLEALLVYHGLRGGPFETRRRRIVPRLIYLDFASHLCQVAFNGYCTHLVYGAEPPVCPDEGLWNPTDAALALVWCTWALIAFLLGLLVLCYNLFPDYRDPASWEKRCNCLGTVLCCRRGRRGQYRDLSGQQQRLSSRLGNIFAMMLSHIDLSPSDILLAFSLAMLLQRIQRRRQRDARDQQQAQRAQHAHEPPAEGEPQNGAAGAGPGHAPSGHGGGSSSHRAGIEMSPQGSPEPAASVCSIEELLSLRAAGSDLEAAWPSALGGLAGNGGRAALRPSLSARPLLSKRYGAAGSSSQGGGAGGGRGGPPNVDRLSGTASFVPAHPSDEEDGNLQLGAEKTGEGPPGREPREPGAAPPHQPVDAETLAEAAGVMKYAFASYGMLLFIFSKPGTGILQLCFGRNCGLLLGTAGGRRARNKLDLRLLHNLNREATQQAAGLADADLLDVRYEGEAPHVLPYFLAADAPRRRLVLAIRGSLSLDDVVRDLLFEPASLDEWLTPGRRWEEPPPEVAHATAASRYAAHAGILEAARATFCDIQEHGVLHRLLLTPGGRCAGWRLVVTGHSLGAGCAFLLSLYLRHFCPNLRCWAFSPPGGLCSAEVCAEAAGWCTSVVCGKEWIPRLSVATFSRMRDEMVYAALRCRQPKWWVLLGLVRGRRWSEVELFYAPDELPSEAVAALDAYHLSVQRNKAVQEVLERAGDFGPPGRCFHLRPTGKVTGTGGWRRRAKQRQYRAVWVDGRDIVGQGILLSGRMMADHMPDYLLATLRSMSRSMKHQRSTATVSDKAGERLTDQIFEHEPQGGQGGHNGGAASAAGSEAGWAPASSEAGRDGEDWGALLSGVGEGGEGSQQSTGAAPPPTQSRPPAVQSLPGREAPGGAGGAGGADMV